jgi:hypothetical protein
MKKVILGMSALIAVFSAASACANISEEDYSGFRAGLGYSQTSIDTDGGDADGKGFKAEVGYDLNRIIGFDVSYETANDTLQNIANDADIEGATVKAGADIGYAFYSKKVFFKPYAKVGFVSYSEDNYDGSSAFAGLGVRYQYSHVYVDLNADAFFLDADNDDNYKFVQGAFIVGYKF